MSAVLFVAIAYMYRVNGALFEKRHLEYVEILRETSAALMSVTNSTANVIAALDKIEIRIQEANTSNNELRQVIEYCKNRSGNNAG